MTERHQIGLCERAGGLCGHIPSQTFLGRTYALRSPAARLMGAYCPSTETLCPREFLLFGNRRYFNAYVAGIFIVA
jgi:hypothetical protein